MLNLIYIQEVDLFRFDPVSTIRMRFDSVDKWVDGQFQPILSTTLRLVREDVRRALLSRAIWPRK